MAATDAVIAADDVQAHQANMNKIVNKLKQLGIEVTRAEPL